MNIIKSGEVEIEGLTPDLKGSYQRLNIPGVLETIDKLIEFDITDNNIMNGLERVVQNTNLKGRWQTLNKQPLTICDTGHNVDGVNMIINQLGQYNYEQLHIVWGMVEDKSINEVLTLLPTEAHYYFCAADIPRALNANKLANEALKLNLKGESYKSVLEAIAAAKINARNNDLIFIGGSTFVVAEIEEL